MIALSVSLRVVADRHDEFVAAITENAAQSAAEPGCRRFDVVRDLADDLHYLFYELYTDEDAVAAHRAAPHFAVWRAAADRCVEPGSQVNTLAVVLLSHEEARS